MADKFKYFLAAMTVIFLVLGKATLQTTWFVLGLCVRFVLFFTVGVFFGMTVSRAVHPHEDCGYGH